MSLRVAESDRHGIRIGPEHADGRAPARGEPVATGKPWTVDSGEGALCHVNVGIPARRMCSPRAREITDPENTNRVTDDRLIHTFGSGWADAHATGVLHRLVNIGTRLPGRAV